ATQPHAGSASAFVSATTTDTTGFGTLMEEFPAARFAGNRLRLAAFTRSEGVQHWAGVWMRVDGRSWPLAFDNMNERPIRATTDWTRHEIVLDVPKDATNIAFGVLLVGAGKVWMDDLAFDVVGRQVATTSSPVSRARGIGEVLGRLGYRLGLGNVSASR